MAPKPSTKEDQTHLTVSTPDDEFIHKERKLLASLSMEKERAALELAANAPFGKILATWKPDGRELRIKYMRQHVQSGSNSALTASNMKQGDLMVIGWLFSRDVRLNHPVAVESRNLELDIEIQARVLDLGRRITLLDGKVSLPTSLNIHPTMNARLEPESPSFAVTTQLIRFSVAVFLNESQGDLLGCPALSPEAKETLEINWAANSGDADADGKALGVLFHLVNPGKASSELVVERTMGSLLQVLFDSIEFTETTSGQTMQMLGTLSAYGSHPRPDFCARAKDFKHPLISPVCLIGESKTMKTRNADTLAQLATTAHSTLMLFVIAWCLQNPPHHTRDVKFPGWAFLLGLVYTEDAVEIYAFHPKAATKWTFNSLRIHTFNGVLKATSRKKLEFFHAMVQVREHAKSFREGMVKLLDDVFQEKGNVVVIKEQIIKNHPAEHREKLRRISNALVESLEKWNKLVPAA